MNKPKGSWRLDTELFSAVVFEGLQHTFNIAYVCKPYINAFEQMNLSAYIPGKVPKVVDLVEGQLQKRMYRFVFSASSFFTRRNDPQTASLPALHSAPSSPRRQVPNSPCKQREKELARKVLRPGGSIYNLLCRTFGDLLWAALRFPAKSLTFGLNESCH